MAGSTGGRGGIQGFGGKTKRVFRFRNGKGATAYNGTDGGPPPCLSGGASEAAPSPFFTYMPL